MSNRSVDDLLAFWASWLVMMLGEGFDDFHISEALRRDEELVSGKLFGLTHEEVVQAAREVVAGTSAA